MKKVLVRGIVFHTGSGFGDFRPPIGVDSGPVSEYGVTFLRGVTVDGVSANSNSKCDCGAIPTYSG